jgi:hypothetical protein
MGCGFYRRGIMKEQGLVREALCVEYAALSNTRKN